MFDQISLRTRNSSLEGATKLKFVTHVYIYVRTCIVSTTPYLSLLDDVVRITAREAGTFQQVHHIDLTGNSKQNTYIKKNSKYTIIQITLLPTKEELQRQ